MGQFDPSERDLQARMGHERTHTHSMRDVSDLLVSLDADDDKRRASAAWELAEVAADTPERVPVSDLTNAITDGNRWVRRGATWALAEIAQTNPDGARPAMECVFDLIGDGDPLVRENAVVTVAGVAEAYPRATQPALASLLELLVVLLLGHGSVVSLVKGLGSLSFAVYGIVFADRLESLARGTSIDTLRRHLLPVLVCSGLLGLTDLGVVVGVESALVGSVENVFVVMIGAFLLTATIRLQQNVRGRSTR